ncbi:hypothetical protein LIER_31305 [Lithospermum erythrorhizon]|uniref:Uncharacterized protein n=1 Tax=Lithospermum erythrorhizon TaxID=34254 RepID=A0AAV3RQM7_LITER
MLHHGMKRYFEEVTRASQLVREADFRRTFHLPTLDGVLHKPEIHVLHSRDRLTEAVQRFACYDAYYRALLSAGAPASDIKATRQLLASDRVVERIFLHSSQRLRLIA